MEAAISSAMAHPNIVQVSTHCTITKLLRATHMPECIARTLSCGPGLPVRLCTVGGLQSRLTAQPTRPLRLQTYTYTIKMATPANTHVTDSSSTPCV